MPDMQETVQLGDWMSHAKHEMVALMTKNNIENAERLEQRRVWISRSVRLSLAIARAASSMCIASYLSEFRQRQQSSFCQSQELTSDGEAKQEEDFRIFDVDDVMVRISDYYEPFDAWIDFAGDKKKKIEDSKTSMSDIEDGIGMEQKYKLIALGHILRQLFQSVAPFPTLDLTVNGARDEEEESTVCSYDPPTKRRGRRRSSTTMTEEDKETKLEDSLKESGIPPVLCELVANLLFTLSSSDTNDRSSEALEQNIEGDEAASFLDPYTIMQDVITDLEHIQSDPEKFLFGHNCRDGTASISMVTVNNGGVLFQDRNIYGRESQISQLFDAFDRTLGRQQNKPGSLNNSANLGDTSPRHREIIFLSGQSGSGKSALMLRAIQERCFHIISDTADSIQGDTGASSIGNPNITDNGSGSSNITSKDSINTCFLHGKFDERMHRSQPLSAIVSAFDAYCIALLKNEVDGLSEVRSALRNTLGSDCKILTDLIPNLFEVIYPDKKRTSELNSSSSPAISDKKSNDNSTTPTKNHGQEAKNRLKFLFCKFVRAISRPSHPIVLFLDDLHWVDVESLELMYSLIVEEQQEAKLSNFLFLGCYRDNEVSEEHILNKYTQRVQKEGVVVTNISVGNMTRENVNEMLSDNLQLLPRLTRPLANIVQSKTSGSPLFVRQFLTCLVDKGLLRYSLLARRWTWNCEGIRCEYIADDLAQLMIDKLCGLKTSVRYALMIAACFGTLSQKSILQKLDAPTADETNENDNNNQDMIDLIEEAVSEGLVAKVGSISYMFPHDMIQSTAYSLVPDAAHMHLEIGRQLWEKCSETELDQNIFVITTQLNEGSGLITDHDEKIKLAALNLIAGRKCMDKTAFSPALLYLKGGAVLLDVEDWQSHYKLCLDIHICFAEMLCAGGHWKEMNGAIGQVFTFANSFEDKIPAYITLIKSLGLQDKIPLAITSCLEVLSLLGETFPGEVDRVMVEEDFFSTQALLEGTTMEGIALADEMQDVKKVAAMKFLAILSLHIYYASSQDLLPLVLFRMIRLTLIHGVCEESAYAFATFGYIVINLRNDFGNGYKFGSIALSLVKRLEGKEYAARVHFVVYGMVNVWKDPLQACLDGLSSAYDIGISNGDVLFLSTVGSLICVQSLHCGLPLEPLAKHLKSLAWSVKESKQDFNIRFILLYTQVVLNLIDCPGDPTEFTGEVMDQSTALTAAINTDNFNFVMSFYYLRMWVSYLFGRYQLAQEMLEQSQSATQNGSNQRLRHGILVNEAFYTGLVALAKARETKRRKWKIEGCKSIEKFKVWAEAVPWNYEHKLKLLQAELFFLDGKIDSAQKAYNESIETARKHRFFHEEAIACERLGIFHHTLGNHITARDHFSRCHELYLSWGAKCKAEDVLAKYLVK